MAERFLVLAPRGRDAVIAAQVLARRGIAVQHCADLAALHAAVAGAVGGVLVTEEALDGPSLESLLCWIEAQPPWSDLPFVVLTTPRIGSRPPGAAQTLERLGNVVLLERPINADTLLSAAAAALRARRRQYGARQLNETLEQHVRERTRELEQARETLMFALDSAGMGTWDYDLRTDRSRRSARHDRIFGHDVPQRDWSMTTFLDHVLPDDRVAVTARFAAAVETGSLEFECRIGQGVDPGVGQAGTDIRWIAVKGRVEYDGDGLAVRMAGVVMDITERRLTEGALQQAQRMEAIGQLTGGVAHDFNNLLTVIVGGLDMVLRRPEHTDRVVRLAEAAMTAARRGEQLTQQLLAFSRRQMMRPETLDPVRLLHGFEALAARAVGETVTLRFELEAGTQPVRVDPAQFESAVLNLIVNARDALIEKAGAERVAGDPCVTVRCRDVAVDALAGAERGLAPGAYVEVAVIDNGSGFEPHTLARAFEPFFTTKEIGKGSGLGLSQVYGFTRSAGGDVLIDSAPGAGTAVRLCFPRSPDAVAVEPVPLATVAPLREAAAAETVLLVEDDEQVLGMAVESLEELRYLVLVARNAGEALEQLRGDRRIDLLFTDVMMPGGMNGTELAAEAQRLRPGLKVLLTSGYVGEAGIGQEFGGALPLLTKPYRRDELAETLRESLGHR